MIVILDKLGRYFEVFSQSKSRIFHCFKRPKTPEKTIRKSLNITVVSALELGNNLFKVNNESTKTMCVICSKLTIKTPERRQ